MHLINLIFLGSFPYPQGMAATKRIQHAIDGLKQFKNIQISVIVLRQSSAKNTCFGFHKAIPYQTIMPDLFRLKFSLLAPIFYVKSLSAIKSAYIPNKKNILYVYGPPTFDNVPIVRYARKIGFKVIFDIVEDDSVAVGLSKSAYHRIKTWYTCKISSKITSLSDALIVISSHLLSKFRKSNSSKFPIHYRPISIDYSQHPNPSPINTNKPALFYSGSFGIKDGIPILFDAFDKLAANNTSVRLIMTGVGSPESMKSVISRIDSSPYRDRIEYMGYLSDTDYYTTLRNIDIPSLLSR